MLERRDVRVRVSAKEEGQRRLLFGSIPKDDCFCAAPTPTKRKYNVLWMLIDDVSVERFPESGNTALEGLLPGFNELKADGAIYYDNLYERLGRVGGDLLCTVVDLKL